MSAERPQSSKQEVDDLVTQITNPNARPDQQSRALRRLEEIASVSVVRVLLGVPLRPETLPESERLQ